MLKVDLNTVNFAGTKPVGIVGYDQYKDERDHRIKLDELAEGQEYLARIIFNSVGNYLFADGEYAADYLVSLQTVNPGKRKLEIAGLLPVLHGAVVTPISSDRIAAKTTSTLEFDNDGNIRKRLIARSAFLSYRNGYFTSAIDPIDLGLGNLPEEKRLPQGPLARV